MNSKKEIENSFVSSILAILNLNGNIDLIGVWQEDKGIYYSNGGYKETLFIASKPKTETLDINDYEEYYFNSELLDKETFFFYIDDVLERLDDNEFIFLDKETIYQNDNSKIYFYDEEGIIYELFCNQLEMIDYFEEQQLYKLHEQIRDSNGNNMAIFW